MIMLPSQHKNSSLKHNDLNILQLFVSYLNNHLIKNKCYNHSKNIVTFINEILRDKGTK